jgi:ferric-dicitrate binding protein FerR (iron transport regulator)
MADEQHLIIAILVKYALRQTLSAAEECALEEWRSRSDEHRRLPDQFRDARWLDEQRRQLELPPTVEMWEEIRHYIDKCGESSPMFLFPDLRRIGWLKLAVVSLVGMIMVTGGFFWWKSRRTNDAAKLVFDRPVVIPSKFGAVLELSDGRMIGLDTVPIGAVMMSEGGVTLTKSDSNSYVYSGSTPTRQRLSISAGGPVLRIQWPGGSKAWLNKGSSLEYTTDLRSAEARITGEAWFRVAHDAGRSVAIRTAGGTLTRVLGTSFDVRAIAGIPERVALFSGKLRVVKGGDSVLLNSGSQLEVNDSMLSVTHKVDSNAMLAWLQPVGKGKWFDFHNADLLMMLPEIASWWRVTLVNPQKLAGVGITGGFPRRGPLETIIKNLKTIEDKHVQLTVKDDTIYVAPLRPGG